MNKYEKNQIIRTLGFLSMIQMINTWDRVKISENQASG